MPKSLAVRCPVIVSACLIFANDKGPREKAPTQAATEKLSVMRSQANRF